MELNVLPQMESALVFDVTFCGIELNELTKFIVLNIKKGDFAMLLGCTEISPL